MRRQGIYLLVIFAILIGVFLVVTKSRFFRKAADYPSSPRVQSALKNAATAPFYKDLVPPQTDPAQNPGYHTSPEFKIGQYIVTTALPEVPQTLSLYEFKTSFSDEEVTNLASKLLGSSVQKDDEADGVANYSGDLGFMAFNKNTGTFSMASLNIKLPFVITDHRNLERTKPLLTDYLQRVLGVIDDTVTLTALYQKKGDDAITYYELHRDTSKMGLPLINPIGVINTDESTPLAAAQPGASALRDAVDDSIIFASDQPGRVRQTDFNTMTVAISDDGHVLSIDSNIRPIEKKNPLSGADLTLFPPRKALEELPNKGTYFNIAVPAGEGYIDLSKVYRDNQFVSGEATVTDIVLAFLEKPAGVFQKYLQPVYIVRGYAETDTGVRVRFSQTIPALEKNSGASLTSRLLDVFFPSVFAQSVQSSEIVIPCDDGSTGKCRMIRIRKTPTPTQPPTPTPFPPAPNATTPSPTPMPVPSVTPRPPTDVCVLLTSNGTLVEQGSPLYIPGFGTVYYFPSSLPNGPIAMPRSLGSGSGTVNTAKFKRVINDHLVAIAAQRILANPSLPYFDEGHYPYYSVHLNVIFPESGINFDKPHSASSWAVSSDDTYIKEKLYRVHHPTATVHPTLQELAQSSVITAFVENNFSIAQLWFFREKPPIGIYGNFVVSSNCQISTTVSPYIYFYPPQQLALLLTFGSSAVSYVDPYKAQPLQFMANPDGALFFGPVQRDFMHYEYTNTSFKRPHQGWVMKGSEVEAFINTDVSGKVGLLPLEEQGLLNELRGALQGKNLDKTVFVGLLPQSEVETALPFTVSPRPDKVYRLHLYIEFVDEENSLRMDPPALTPVVRGGFYIVETGVYVK